MVEPTTSFTERLKARLGFDYAYANELEVIDGKLQQDDGTGDAPFAAPLDLASVLVPE